MFQMGGVGPMMGQANVSTDTSRKRFNRRSTGTRMSAGVFSRCSTRISATASGWRTTSRLPTSPIGAGPGRTSGRGVSREGLPHLKRWMDTMKERPALRRGVEIPFKRASLLKDDKAAEAFARDAQKTLQR